MKLTVAAFGGLVLCLVASLRVASASGPTTVLNANDAGPGSLRAAMELGAPVIDFDPSFFGVPRSIKLNSPLPEIWSDLQIIGPGASLLTVDGQSKTNPSPLLAVYSSSTVVRLEGFTLTGGYDPISTGNVGGIFSRGRLTLAGMRLNGNRGTALFNQSGTVDLEQTEVTNNTSHGVFNQGGTLNLRQSFVGSNGQEGIFNQVGAVTIANSTFTQNNGGIYNQSGDLSIYNSTISANRAYGVASTGGGPVPRLFTAHSTIFANHTSFDLAASENSMINYSLIEFLQTTINGVGNIIGVDPLLGPLGNHGGLSPSLLPQVGSQAIDAGSNLLGLVTDQRGAARVSGGRADIGAVETIPEPATFWLGMLGAVALHSGRRAKP